MIRCATFIVLFVPTWVHAEAPVASYIFPAGGQRGTTVNVRVGGLNLHKSCTFTMEGPGVQASKTVKRMPTPWFEGPVLPLPDSQRQEDYPKDMAGTIAIAKDASLGVRYWRLNTSQGATPAMRFVVGDLPEVVEQEIEGEPIPVDVKLPVTINGRIFPRADVDAWRFAGKKGVPITCELHAARLGSPLDARFEIVDEKGRLLAESEGLPGGDARLRFIPPYDGNYLLRIHDIAFQGSQMHVYRLTVTDGPYVDGVFPLGGKRGSKTAVEVTGQALTAKATLDVPQPDGPSFAWLQLSRDGKPSNSFLFDVDDLDEVLENPGKAQKVSVPAVCNGRIAQPGEIDEWRVGLKKGETLTAEVRAARLGSPLDAVLTLLGSDDKELARAEAPTADGGEATLRFTAPADGEYRVRVQDRFRSRGGPAFAYRLRLSTTAEPDFRLRLATSAVTVLRGGKAQLQVFVDRLGNFSDPIKLTVDGLPQDVKAKWNDPGKGPSVNIQLDADKDAKIDTALLTIAGTAQRGGTTITRTAAVAVPYGQPALENVLLAVGLPTPFKIKGGYDMQWAARGGMLKRKYTIERLGYDGPLEISLADKQARHLQGVHGPTLVVPAGATEFEYAVHLPPWMEIGRTSRTCVMAVAVVKDADGRAHEVSFSSVNQNEQMVAVVEAGKLNVSLDRPALLLAPGKTVELPVEVARAPGLEGPVTLTVVVPPHVQGLRVEQLMLGKGESKGLLRLHCGPQIGPFNVPLTVRATMTSNGRVITAEAKVEVVLEQ